MSEVDDFIAVNRALFLLCDEERAHAHIASLNDPSARDLAKSLWLVEKLRRDIAADKSNADAAKSNQPE